MIGRYLRREERGVFTFSLFGLALCLGASAASLSRAEGRLVPDEEARASSRALEARAEEARSCRAAASRLATEIDVFKTAAKAARLAADPDAGPPGRRGRPKSPDTELAWPTAQPAHKQAKSLAACKLLLATVSPPGRKAAAEAGKSWEAVLAAAAMPAPPDNDDKAQIASARRLLGLLEDAPIAALVAQAKAAEAKAREEAANAARFAETASVREPLPDGLLPRKLALGLGFGIAALGLVVSTLSLLAAAARRARALGGIHRALEQARNPASAPGASGALRGAQAATLLRLAAQPNGGEPGMVLGAGLGGLGAALLAKNDADFFAAASMAGLLIGLGVQWIARIAAGARSFRRRALALAEIEKPVLPIPLILSGIEPGLEADFVAFLENLAPADAAVAVERMAAQAEEKIIAEAAAAPAPWPTA